MSGIKKRNCSENARTYKKIELIFKKCCIFPAAVI